MPDDPAVAFVLLTLGLLLLAIEIAHPGLGVSGVLGLISVGLGGWAAADNSVTAGGFVIVCLAALGTAVAVAGHFVGLTRRLPSTLTGAERFAGRVVTVQRAAGEEGQAVVDGAWWTLRSAGQPLSAGQEVTVTAVDGLVLVVEPVASSAQLRSG